MKRVVLILGAAALAGATGLAGCADTTEGGPEDEGSVELSLTSAPADAACLRITVEASRNTTRLIDLTPGAPTTYLFKRLPVGRAVFDGQAFGVTCAKLPAYTGDPLFVAEAPVPVRIDPVDVVRVTLRLIRNGEAG